jgi:hypothetical protein
MYMEMSQWNSLYSYLKQIKVSFFNNKGQEGKTGLVWSLLPVVGGGYKGRMKEDECVEICTHVWKCLNEPCWNYSKKESGIKENDGGVNLTKMYCKHFCKCPKHHQ